MIAPFGYELAHRLKAIHAIRLRKEGKGEARKEGRYRKQGTQPTIRRVLGKQDPAYTFSSSHAVLGYAGCQNPEIIAPSDKAI